MIRHSINQNINHNNEKKKKKRIHEQTSISESIHSTTLGDWHVLQYPLCDHKHSALSLKVLTEEEDSVSIQSEYFHILCDHG